MGFKLKLTMPKVNKDWYKNSKKELTDIVKQHNKESWSAAKDPVTSSPWTPRKAPTGSWPLLKKTGKMFGTTKITSSNEPFSFKARTVDYGKFHQYGTSKMPQRRWLGIGGEATSKMAKVIAGKIFKGKTTITIGS